MKVEKCKIGQSKLIPRFTSVKSEEGGDSCKRHPSLDLDTICFHPACRQEHSQIICSYCGQESQQHRKHIEQQFPIYRTSPGFRLVNNYPAESGDIILPSNLEQNNEVTQEIKTLVQSQMQQVLGQSLQKIKCLSEFMNKNAIFSICNKIRRKSGEHQDCCLRMINKLKDIEAEGEMSDKDYELAVLEEIQCAKQQAKHQAHYIKAEIQKLFGNLKGEVKVEDVQGSYEEEDTPINEERKNHFSSSLINQLMNMSDPEENRRQRGQRRTKNDQPFPRVNEKSRSKRSQSAVISRKNQNKIPKGVQLLNENTIRIWNGNIKKYHDIFKFLSAQTTVSHLIIENQNFTSNTYINTILSKMSWLQGLHVHCRSKFHFSLPPKSQLQYFSFLPSYRFIRLVDRCQYFSNSQAKPFEEQAKGNIEIFADDVRFKNMYIYKNDNVKFPLFIEELLFFRSQHDLPWTLRKQVLMKLDFPGNLFILAFNDIIFSQTVCLKNIFLRCCRLHTLVFKNCEGRYNKIIKQLRYLKTYQLCHLQVSGADSDKRISLQQYYYKEIFHNRALQTLILTNVEFLDERKKIVKNSHVLKEIHRLKFLTHLNLYSSEPVYNDLFGYIHNECYQNMEMLNLGLTQITPDAKKYLSQFRKLQSLCLDYSGLQDYELLLITKEMHQLRHLSLENMQISAQFFTNMQYKSLKNVNIFGCEKLREYRWENFSELECLRINKGQISFELFYYLRARAIAINVQEVGQAQDQTRSFQSNDNTNGSGGTIDEQSAQSESQWEAEQLAESDNQRNQSLPQPIVTNGMEVSIVTTRSRKLELKKKHEPFEEPSSNPVSTLLNSKVEDVSITTHHEIKGYTICLSDQESD